MNGAAQNGGRGMQDIAAIVLAAGGARRMGRASRRVRRPERGAPGRAVGRAVAGGSVKMPPPASL